MAPPSNDRKVGSRVPRGLTVVAADERDQVIALCALRALSYARVPRATLLELLAAELGR